MTYAEAMAGTLDLVVAKLKEAQRNGRSHLMIIHGSSTSRRGKTTARSQIRNFMRSKHATPLIDRKESIQHPVVFVAKLRQPQSRSSHRTDGNLNPARADPLEN